MRFNSKLIHAGWDSDENSEGSITVPIYRTTAYQFNNTEHAANLFGLKEFGNIYSRLGNPTVGALEARLTALEDGAMCVALSSGTSAVMYSLINIMSQGDNFVTANQLYGGTYTMFDNILPEYGIISKKQLPKVKFDAIVLAVAHDEFKNIDFSDILKEINVVYDVKNLLPNSITDRTL